MMLSFRTALRGPFSPVIKAASGLLALLAFCSVGFAEESPAAKPTAGPIEPAAAVSATLPETPQPHQFWDRKNQLLFAGVAGVNAADFAVTRSNLENGGKELNPITRLFSGSTAGLLANFTGETVATMGISYLFHKTGHHRMERITSAVAMSVSTHAVIYSSLHRR
jgi:hypothetical protein